MNLYLKEPTLEDKAEVLAMFNEFNSEETEYPFEGASRLKKVMDNTYEDWVLLCNNDKTIEDVNPDRANATNYLLVDENNHVYGFSQLRHKLVGDLINIGGNIGYCIRPTERRKGYGTLQLNLILDKARELNLDKVLITCRENNIGSSMVIKNCNGINDKSVPSRYPNIMELRYWIYLK